MVRERNLLATALKFGKLQVTAMIVMDNQCISIVEDTGFLCLWSYLSHLMGCPLGTMLQTSHCQHCSPRFVPVYKICYQMCLLFHSPQISGVIPELSMAAVHHHTVLDYRIGISRNKTASTGTGSVAKELYQDIFTADDSHLLLSSLIKVSVYTPQCLSSPVPDSSSFQSS